MRKYLIAAAALLTLSAPAAMAQSRDGFRGGEQHSAQRSYGNYGYNGRYAYNGVDYRQAYRDNYRQAYRSNDRGYRNDRRHERRERREHRRDYRY